MLYILWIITLTKNIDDIFYFIDVSFIFINEYDEHKISEILNYKFTGQKILLQTLKHTSGLNAGKQLHKIGIISN